MTILDDQRVIAIEEHYSDPEVIALFEGVDGNAARALARELEDVGEARLRSMDEAGIDIQILSHAPPGPQRLDGETAIRVSKAANDRLYEICRAHPNRFAGFAMLPTPDPKAAAGELERTVNSLGFKGGMIHGLTGPERLFFDEPQFWPVYERAQALGVPLYIHPAIPHPAVIDAYFKDYAKEFPGLITAGWGFTMETATAGIRIVLSGVLDAYPDVKLILGHLGETLPFLLWRIDMALNRPGNRPVAFRDAFTSHFYVTTSGFFSDPALLCCLQEMGAERILFAIDYPFVANAPGPAWIERLMLNRDDKAKILHGNAERLFGL